MLNVSEQSLYKGLMELMDYEGDDIEDTFSQTFRVCYQDVFGTVLHHDLKDGGEHIPVNKKNRRVCLALFTENNLNGFPHNFTLISPFSGIC